MSAPAQDPSKQPAGGATRAQELLSPPWMSPGRAGQPQAGAAGSAPQANAVGGGAAPALRYQPIDAAIASRFQQCTGENVSNVLIAENPDLLNQGKRGVAIQGRCVQVIPGSLLDLGLCAHELTHIVQQRGNTQKQKNNRQLDIDPESEASIAEKNIAKNEKMSINCISPDEFLYKEQQGREKPGEEDLYDTIWSAANNVLIYKRLNPEGPFPFYDGDFSARMDDLYIYIESLTSGKFLDLDPSQKAIIYALNQLNITSSTKAEVDFSLEDREFLAAMGPDYDITQPPPWVNKDNTDRDKQWMQNKDDIAKFYSPTIRTDEGCGYCVERFRPQVWKCNKLVGDSFMSQYGANLPAGDEKTIGFPMNDPDVGRTYSANDFARSRSSKDFLGPEINKIGRSFPRRVRYNLGTIQFQGSEVSIAQEIHVFNPKGETDSIFKLKSLDDLTGIATYDQYSKEGVVRENIPGEDIKGIEANPGEIIAFYDKTSSGHMGISLGFGLFISALNATHGVGIVSISSYNDIKKQDVVLRTLQRGK